MSHPTIFEFILIDAFSMMSMVTAIEPLRVANRILGEDRYVWRMVQEDGAAPLASNGLSFSCVARQPNARDARYTFVCAGMHTALRNPTQLYSLLNRRKRQGNVVGGISLAPAILARAGLLKGRRAVIHWEGLAAFKEEFPDIEVSTDLYMIDGDVMTSSGGLATLDLFLRILFEEHESWLVQAVSNQLQVAQARSATDPQHGGSFRLPVTAPKTMHKATALIDQNIEHPLSLDALSDAAGASRRTLDRQFKAYTAQSIGKFYMMRRLEHAKVLLTHSNLSVSEVGLAAGFSSTSHFADRFRKFFGQPPRKWRGTSCETHKGVCGVDDVPNTRQRHGHNPAFRGYRL